tara:strand:+ start:444 stop:596 length:153 start_codon:yes stop_codon:yes gene_type:complete
MLKEEREVIHNLVEQVVLLQVILDLGAKALREMKTYTTPLTMEAQEVQES